VSVPVSARSLRCFDGLTHSATEDALAARAVSYPGRALAEGELHVVEELAEGPLRRQRPRHGVVPVVHRGVVLVQ